MDLDINRIFNKNIIKIVTVEEFIEQCLADSGVIYTFKEKIYKERSSYYGHKMKCCMCLTKKAYWSTYLGGHYYKNLCGNSHRYHGVHIFFCKSCYSKALIIADNARETVYRAIKIMRSILNDDVCNIIKDKFNIIASYYRIYVEC